MISQKYIKKTQSHKIFVRSSSEVVRESHFFVSQESGQLCSLALILSLFGEVMEESAASGSP